MDMLKENEEIISFYPGCATPEGTTKSLGRIVVHDRLKVEADILPRYFNHSSFASLRRQLNYFCFTRMGKGRQRGATYCNDGVVVMEDILRLKRRSTLLAATPATHSVSGSNKRERPFTEETESSTDNDEDGSRPTTTRRTKKSRPSVVTPRSSPVCAMEEGQIRRISLDLTMPSTSTTHLSQPCLTTSKSMLSPHLISEDDVLAGCRALLSFSRSTAVEDLVA